MRVRYEDRALAQIERIRDWIEERAGADTADRIVNSLFTRCEGSTIFRIAERRATTYVPGYAPCRTGGATRSAIAWQGTR